jgi:mannosyltransferase OCH1-like enzyme
MKLTRKEILQLMTVLNKYKQLIKPFILKPKYDSIIPFNIFQTWHTKALPEKMQQTVDYLKEANPAFKHYLYDDDDCRNFIEQNYSSDVLWAFDSLIPGAYKADLWRYCILYKFGGIYLDIKYKPINNFKLISLTEKEYFVRDRPDKCVYNALMVCLPGNEILLNCINQIVENVKNKFYGKDGLYPTGPGLLGCYFTNQKINQLEMYFDVSFAENVIHECYIVYNDGIILKEYKEYRLEQTQTQKNKVYRELWGEKNIYK